MASRLDSRLDGDLTLEAGDSSWIARFPCFGGPCELHLRGAGRGLARELAAEVQREALRIQARYSRYDEDSWLSSVNRAAGDWHPAGEEDLALLELAHVAHQVSGGRFDATSGVLRRAWNFTPGSRPPRAAEVAALLERVGWRRVERDVQAGRVRLPAGAELDLGGLGKEYAVDRAAAWLTERAPGAFLVNFGGDLRAGGADGTGWSVGLDDPDQTGRAARGGFRLATGALATSGDARRGLVWRGKRYGHILDARTGWPPPGAPRSVTVHAPTCSQAGLLSTIGLLMGRHADDWLSAQGAAHWVLL